ncbi:squalene synthase-like [Acanthaster planci]|uniref:Squalene synthase n=1 Tax=Acanthaster planci TaxID=133434 RepID=A0A8B7XRE9_ACAPL|nr:squalene synthase-like [Acanthaster planci]XP_022083419.1 squalene synthase-like [Acanthaster planci]
MDLLKSITHPDEVYALLKYKLGAGPTKPKQDYATMTRTAKKCYEYLNLTSRSFAAVIQALDGDLRHAVCIFYLVLRALDTVEDDMTIPLPEKIPMLQQFHEKLNDPTWNYTKSQEKDRIVLEDFQTIAQEFRSLAKCYRVVIADICNKMGHGMCEFVQRDVVTNKDWDLYCHYVAGLVGIGLSRLFSASKLEDAIVGEDTQLANSMGLFLQKTNIIRDYLEDNLEGREFWPRETWSKYASKLSDFQKPQNLNSAVHCLNELITNALHHVPDVLKYMSRLHNQSVFNFCAIPQVMAIATLAECYNNPRVFSGVVKIRKGQAVVMMLEATSMDSIRTIISNYSRQIGKAIPSVDPSAELTKRIVTTNLELSHTAAGQLATASYYPPLYMSLGIMLALILYSYGSQILHYVNS